MNKKVYLTFETDQETSEILKWFAHIQGKTQPEFINEICQEHKNAILQVLKEKENNTADTTQNQ